MLNDIKNLNEHKKIAINQRNSYNFAKLNLAEGSILIEQLEAKIVNRYNKYLSNVVF